MQSPGWSWSSCSLAAHIYPKSNHKTSGTFNRIPNTGSKITRREQEEGRVLSAFCRCIHNWIFCIYWCSSNPFWILFCSCLEKLIFFFFLLYNKNEEWGKVVLSNVKFKVFSKLIAFASFPFMGKKLSSNPLHGKNSQCFPARADSAVPMGVTADTESLPPAWQLQFPALHSPLKWAAVCVGKKSHEGFLLLNNEMSHSLFGRI